MEKDFQKALEYIRLNGLVGYEVVNENKLNSFVFKYNPEQSADENLNRLRSVMAITPGSWFTLIGWTTNEKNRVQYKYEFSNENKSNIPANVQSVVSGISREELDEQIKLAESRVEQRYKMLDLERREKELNEREREFRKEKESAIGIAISQLGKFFRAAQPAIAGTEDSPMRQVPVSVERQQSTVDGHSSDDIFEPIEETDKADQQTAELEAVLTEWAEADPDWYEVLKKVVALAKTNDPKYTMAKNYL